MTGLLHFSASLKYNTKKLEPCFLATTLKSTPAAFTFQSWKYARLYHLIRSLLFSNWDFSSGFLICTIILVVLVRRDKLCWLCFCETFLSSWRKSWTTCRHGNRIPSWCCAEQQRSLRLPDPARNPSQMLYSLSPPSSTLHVCLCALKLMLLQIITPAFPAPSLPFAQASSQLLSWSNRQ